MKTTEAKNLNKKKKINTYLKYGIILILSFVLGGIIGGLLAAGEDALEKFSKIFSIASAFIGKWFLVFMLVFVVVGLIVGEYSLNRIKKLCKEQEIAENEEDDEKADWLDYKTEKIAAIAMAVMNVSNVLSMIFLAISVDYTQAKDVDAIVFFGGLALYLLLSVYEGTWNIRFVKLNQKMDPSKKGDPTSTKFTEQWVNSCDEGEKEIIKKAAFKSYSVMMQVMPTITVIAILMHWAFNTGLFAVIISGVVTLIQVFSYLSECVKLKKQNLEA